MDFQKLVDNHLRPVLLAHSDPELRHFGMILCEEKLSPQTCRHIFTVLLVLEGESEASIQDWRGDRSPESSHLYMQEKGDLMRRANGAQGAFTTFAINEGEKYIGEE